MSEPVIIEVAVNGVTRKAENPHVPIEPDEIATDALACMAAGAAIVHNHIDGPTPSSTRRQTPGRPSRRATRTSPPWPRPGCCA